MRRKDREIMELNEIYEIIKKCQVCRVAFFDEEYPYVVPLNFGATFDGKSFNFYFHGAKAGKKMALIEKNNKVAFEFDCSHKLVSAEKACDYSMEYESVMGNGEIEILSGDELKKALDHLMRQYSDKAHFEYDEKYMNVMSVYKLKVNHITGKKLGK